MNKRVIFIKYLIFVSGLFLSALGIAFSKQGDLGMSTVSSAPYVMSLKFTSITFGTWSAIFNILFVIGQIVLLRSSFKPVQLLQIPFSFLFGLFTDFGVWLVSALPTPNYAVRAILVLIGIAVLSLGISLAVVADVMYNSGEGLVKAISDVSGKKFGNIKIAFDLSMVLIAVILSLVFFKEIRGVREGTIVAALLTGCIVKLISNTIAPHVITFLKKFE